MDNLTCAYLAGVMDSDGWFSIKCHAANTKYVNSYTYSEYVGCGQTSPEAIELLHGNFGGTVHLRTRRQGPNWKPIYYWKVSNKIAARVAVTLRPHLRVKAAHADIIIALRASKDQPRDYSRSVKTVAKGRALDPEVVAMRRLYYERIRAMNDRRQSNLDLAAS